MVKGFIFFRDGKIPFVIENYRMELFTDDSLLDDFCKEYNFKENYILHGQCFDIGIRGRKATFLVENSMGSTCYLRCYIINMFDKDEEYDSIGLQSPSLDEVFRYEYEYIDMVRAGINLAIEPKVVYKVPFGMNDQKYELEFRIGHDNRLGLLEDLDRKCELILPLHTNEIQECYKKQHLLDVWFGRTKTASKFCVESTVKASDEWLHSYFYFNDEIPTDADFEKSIGDYLTFEFSMIMQNREYLFEDGDSTENVIYNELRKRGYSVDVGNRMIVKPDKNGKTVKKQLKVDFICRNLSIIMTMEF